MLRRMSQPHGWAEWRPPKPCCPPAPGAAVAQSPSACVVGCSSMTPRQAALAAEVISGSRADPRDDGLEDGAVAHKHDPKQSNNQEQPVAGLIDLLLDWRWHQRDEHQQDQHTIEGPTPGMTAGGRPPGRDEAWPCDQPENAANQHNHQRAFDTEFGCAMRSQGDSAHREARTNS